MIRTVKTRLESAARLRKEGERVRFLADGMLGSLAVKLRILGFDSLYDKISSDQELLQIAEKSGRYLLTSDVELYRRTLKAHLRSILVSPHYGDLEKLVEVFSNLEMRRVSTKRRSRCSKCNGKLVVDQGANETRKIYTCENCNQGYWKGSHWKKLDALFFELNSRLKAKVNGDV